MRSIYDTKGACYTSMCYTTISVAPHAACNSVAIAVWDYIFWATTDEEEAAFAHIMDTPLCYRWRPRTECRTIARILQLVHRYFEKNPFITAYGTSLKARIETWAVKSMRKFWLPNLLKGEKKAQESDDIPSANELERVSTQLADFYAVGLITYETFVEVLQEILGGTDDREHLKIVVMYMMCRASTKDLQKIELIYWVDATGKAELSEAERAFVQTFMNDAEKDEPSCAIATKELIMKEYLTERCEQIAKAFEED